MNGNETVINLDPISGYQSLADCAEAEAFYEKILNLSFKVAPNACDHDEKGAVTLKITLQPIQNN